jgi:hypothetical protein
MNITLNCPPVSCYKNYRCDVDYKGRIIGAALVSKSVSSLIDKTDATELLDSLFYQALDGNAILFLNIAGEKPKPETAELPGVGLRINRPGAKTHTLTFVDAQVIANVDSYNKILRSSQNYDLYYFTPDLYWDASGTQVTVIGDPVIQNDLTQFITGDVMIKWVADTNPVPSNFDTDSLLEGLFYEISGSTALSTTVGATGTSNYTAALNYSFGSASLPSKVWSLSSPASVITALGASINSATGVLTITATTLGDYVLTVEVSNASGCIFGTLDVSVTVGAETCIDPVLTYDPAPDGSGNWICTVGTPLTVQVTSTPLSLVYLANVEIPTATDADIFINQDGLLTVVPGVLTGNILFTVNALNGTCFTTVSRSVTIID